MDRQTAYNGELPISADFLQAQQNAMVGLAKLTESLCGTAAFVTGLSCTPTTPTASLSVVLGAGNIYQQVALEATAWSSLPADTADLIVKQGIALQPQTIGPLTPPSTAGFSQVFMIEAQYQDSDANPKVLPYFNPAVLTSPGAANWSGPGNSGASQPTARKGILAVQVKAGTAAATGTQVAPIADTGWVPLWAITLANGQTQITSASIAVAVGAPFLPSTLNGVPAFVQSGAAIYAVDTGAVNTLVVAPNPAPIAIGAGMQLLVKVGHTNTLAATLQVKLASGTQTNNITRSDASALQPGDLVGGETVELSFDGTEWQVPCPAVGAGRTPVADANYTALPTDRIIAYTALTAVRTVSLPAAAFYPNDRILWIVDESGNASASKSITANRNGADTINNGTSAIIAGPYGIVGLESNGSNAWTVVQSRINTFGRTPVADANYTQLLGDRNIAYTAITAARTVTLLPAASFAAGTIVTLRDDSGVATTVNTISAAPNGADQINGSNTTQVMINGAYGVVDLETDGVSKWTVRRAIIIVGGTIDSAVVGGTTPAAGTFTVLKAQAGNSATSVRAGGQIAAQVTPTGTGADTTEDILQTFSLPANTLDAVGRRIRITAYGTFGADANSKTVRVYFGTVAYNSGALTGNGVGWAITLDVWKTGSNTQGYGTSGLYYGASIVSAGAGTLSQTDTAAITIKVTGQNGAAVPNDIICTAMFIEMIN
ncbi:hypothetical protein [Bradyrhizobium sp.]|uniref:hypothetical protein n=1 Tax=Bradyrhizobium sp. TaxID=376 RepID=UPI001EB68395|nr:hypothetical protein [Bradyrhizobium sp.]MBV9984493.1 hypothetical protein [Bradyrhizobium sp.]